MHCIWWIALIWWIIISYSRNQVSPEHARWNLQWLNPWREWWGGQPRREHTNNIVVVVFREPVVPRRSFLQFLHKLVVVDTVVRLLHVWRQPRTVSGGQGRRQDLGPSTTGTELFRNPNFRTIEWQQNFTSNKHSNMGHWSQVWKLFFPLIPYFFSYNQDEELIDALQAPPPLFFFISERH